MPQKKKIGVYFFIVLISAYFLVFMEWVFFATKPSFLSSITTLKLFETLFIVGLECFVISALALIVLLFMTFVFSLLTAMFEKQYSLVLVTPATLLLLFSSILLIDNFTNTVAGYGIAKMEGIFRVFYLLFVLAIAYYIYSKLLSVIESNVLVEKPKPKIVVSSVLIIVSLCFTATGIYSVQEYESTLKMNKGVHNLNKESKRPNIIFFATDGIGASLLSAYGNKHKTTPNLDQLVENSLVAKNAFTNSERTTGSVASMLTGKYPATTKVLFPPHVLHGIDAYQHLPGILKRLGYSTFQESVRYYADANDLNFLSGFDIANGIKNKTLFIPMLSQIQHATLFSNKIMERIWQRIKHILFIEDMNDVYATVKSDGYAKVYGFSDRSRIDRTIKFIEQSNEPFFMHLHLMDTHCCNFKPQKKVFSKGAFTEKRAEGIALLKDLLKESDDYFGEIITVLRETNRLDNTIIVYSSDHTEFWGFRHSVPLIFKFPDGDHAGIIKENTQLLDVAPTILDYLNIEVPDWMEGESLLSGRLNNYRPILGVTQLERGHFKTKNKDVLSHIIGAGPPNYGLNIIGLVICDNWYLYNIKDNWVKLGTVHNHSGTCKPDKLPAPEDVMEIMREHLLSKGFLEY